MNEKLKKLHTRFDALQQRERIMVAGLFLVLLIVAWQILLFDQSAVTVVKLNNQIKAQQQQNTSMKVEIAAYKERTINNPNIKLKNKQKQYLNQIQVLDNKLNIKMKGLISPKKMTAMLKDIFKSNTALTLLSLDKLKTQSMFNFLDQGETENTEPDLKNISVTDDVDNNKSIASAVVYRHPVKIVFTGSFLNAMNYLEAIEKMPWDLYWDAVQLDVEKYPRSKIVITVFTLSLKKGWVGV
jgi:MSHA biogenesis protein MshJ